MVSRLHLDIEMDSDVHASAFRTATGHHSPVGKESLMIVDGDSDDGGDGDSERSSGCSDFGYLSEETGLTSADAYQTVFFPQGQNNVKNQEESGSSSREAHASRLRQEANNNTSSSAASSRKRRSLFRMFRQKPSRADPDSD